MDFSLALVDSDLSATLFESPQNRTTHNDLCCGSSLGLQHEPDFAGLLNQIQHEGGISSSGNANIAYRESFELELRPEIMKPTSLSIGELMMWDIDRNGLRSSEIQPKIDFNVDGLVDEVEASDFLKLLEPLDDGDDYVQSAKRYGEAYLKDAQSSGSTNHVQQLDLQYDMEDAFPIPELPGIKPPF